MINLLNFILTYIIYNYRMGWDRTNDGLTNRFTVYRFDHSATILKLLKRIELFEVGNEPTLRPPKPQFYIFI